jgi:hypothetical protein
MPPAPALAQSPEQQPCSWRPHSQYARHKTRVRLCRQFVYRLATPCPNQSRIDAEAPCHFRHRRSRRHSGREDLHLLLRSPIPPPLLASDHLNPAVLGVIRLCLRIASGPSLSTTSPRPNSRRQRPAIQTVPRGGDLVSVTIHLSSDIELTPDNLTRIRDQTSSTLAYSLTQKQKGGGCESLHVKYPVARPSSNHPRQRYSGAYNGDTADSGIGAVGMAHRPRRPGLSNAPIRFEMLTDTASLEQGISLGDAAETVKRTGCEPEQN